MKYKYKNLTVKILFSQIINGKRLYAVKAESAVVYYCTKDELEKMG